MGSILTNRCDGGIGIPGLLQGRKVLVTGGSSGIGAAVVKALVASSAYVGFTYVKSDTKASMLIEGIGQDRAVSYRADTADPRTMENTADRFASMSGVGRIDGLVCSAGTYNRKSFESIAPEDWDRTMNVNLKGSYNAVRAVLPHMLRGSIVLVSSQIAFRGTRHGADYAASKAGIIGLARALARELAPNIRVNVISPGYIDTDLISSDTPEKRSERGKEVPMGRVGSPMEVANGALFLLSDLSSYITGATIDVSGGLAMGH
jgi:3-oxoacyl-[acyl-carrier protein] reductase